MVSVGRSTCSGFSCLAFQCLPRGVDDLRVYGLCSGFWVIAVFVCGLLFSVFALS